MLLTQQYREVEIKTPLADDILLFRSMTMTEELGRLFAIELELFSTIENINFEDLLGQKVTLRLNLPNGRQRFFNGYVSRFSQRGSLGNYAVYQATVRPWLWFLTRTTNCRIFQHKTIPDIIKEVFRKHGYSDFEDRLSQTYRTREYCVQYRETDFDFISRLMEQEGIYYYVIHQANNHTLVLCDAYNAHDPIAGYETIPYFPPDETAVRKDEHVSGWWVSKQVQPGAYALNEFDFQRPKAKLEVSSARQRKPGEGAFEMYDYPGEYVDMDHGEAYARTRIEALHTQYEQAEAQSDARGLLTGGLFALTGYPREDQNREYLVVSATHTVHSDEYESSKETGAGVVYTNRFSVIDSKTPFRPLRKTLKPIVQGPQTAMVVGPAGEEIHVDGYGRVKVHFHWDRYHDQSDENSSCWIRVSQPWAGKSWGAVSIPRIGQEVIVDFLEGDPDRPIITGRVYNAEQMPPYGLPASGAVSGIKSNTHKGQGYNEMSMDDTAGKEKITIHAQHDMGTTVQHDQTNTIMNHRATTVQNGNDMLTVANGTRTVTVKGGSSHRVQEGSRIVTVTGGDYTVTSTTAAVNIAGKTRVAVKGQTAGVSVTGNGEGVGINGQPKVSITGDDNVFVKAGDFVGIDSPTVDIGPRTIQIHGTRIILWCGESSLEMDGSKIVLHAGSGELTLDAAGATLKGTLVKIN